MNAEIIYPLPTCACNCGHTVDYPGIQRDLHAETLAQAQYGSGYEVKLWFYSVKCHHVWWKANGIVCETSSRGGARPGAGRPKRIQPT